MGNEISLWKDRDEFIQDHLEIIKKSLSENLSQMPEKDLPFMEPHLRALYFETYFLIAQGFYNSGLILCGVLLEALVKEKLFMEGVSDENLEELDFGKATNKAKGMRILSDEELTFFDKRKDTLRNPYAHNNRMKLSKGFEFAVWKIPSQEIVPKIISLLERTQKGEITEEQARRELMKGEPETMTSKDFRPLAQVAKSEMENRFALEIFLEIDKFTRAFAEKYFRPKK